MLHVYISTIYYFNDINILIILNLATLNIYGFGSISVIVDFIQFMKKYKFS